MPSNIPTKNSRREVSEYSLAQNDASQDAPPPRSGPGFLRLNSIIYRIEMLLLTLVILVILFYWRLVVAKDLNLLATLFWIVWPDLGSFIPIGLAARGSKHWPRWGPTLYNLLHTFLVWIPVFAIWSLATGTIQYPLLGWAVHITADRTVGYYLRASTDKRSPQHIV